MPARTAPWSSIPSSAARPVSATMPRTTNTSPWLKKALSTPTKVVRTGLENASSIASMVLVTESLVADIPEEAKGGAPDMSGMGGMGGMGGMIVGRKLKRQRSKLKTNESSPDDESGLLFWHIIQSHEHQDLVPIRFRFQSGEKGLSGFLKLR